MSPSSPTSFTSETDPFLDAEKLSLSPVQAKTAARSLFLHCLHISSPRLRSSSLALLLPSFLQRNRVSSTPSSTAWLDGMRGWASFIVYVRHFSSATHPNLQYGYGVNEHNVWLIQLPFLRLVTAGPAMVALFFIISGYALSWAPLKTLHSKSGAEGALLRLSSATFRRAARLFLPAIVSTFLVACCLVLGLYDRGHRAINSNDMPGFKEPEPPRFEMSPWYVHFQSWLRVTLGFLQIWVPVQHSYDVHLWTLPIEFRCSIILFISLVGFARCRPALRAAMLFGMILYCHYTNFWPGWLFFAGSFLAQLKFIQEDGCARPTTAVGDLLPIDTQSVEPEQPRFLSSPHHSSRVDVVRVVLFIAGLYLLSAPDSGFAASAPGYVFLSKHLTPASWPENWRLMHCLGAFLTVYATSSTHISVLRWLFANPLSAYLGSISYALYLVHGPVVHMLGFWLVPWFWDRIGARDAETGLFVGMWKKELGFGFAFVIVTVLVVWGADLFWRGVDVKCVQLAKWVEGKLVDKSA